MRILLVEDERQLAEALEQTLKKNNYTVDLAFDGEYGLDCALSGIYDIIILDVMLPKLDGIGVLRALRQGKNDTPVLLLTARGDTEDKVRGLDSGADDYLPKPFRTEELLARLRALCRRRNALMYDGVLRYGDLELDPHTLMLVCGGKTFRLTLKECQLLEMLMTHGRMVISKDAVIEKLWGYDTDAGDNHVEVYVSFLRKKLGRLGSKTAISTVRGAGYSLSDDS